MKNIANFWALGQEINPKNRIDKTNLCDNIKNCKKDENEQRNAKL